jgi:hypothetical protein
MPESINEGKPHRQRQRQQQVRRSVEHNEAEPAADANEQEEFPHAVGHLIRTRGFDRLLELGQQQHQRDQNGRGDDEGKLPAGREELISPMPET